MIHVVWAFVVRADAIDRFEQAYGANGSWARLFEQYPGYRGTMLGRDLTESEDEIGVFEALSGPPDLDGKP